MDSKVKNHTGKLLSQDALVKSGDKKLKLKTSTKDLSFVGHRAKETVSNKTGIIVSSKEGNNYTKAIDDGKKSVEDEYKKLNKITNIEERRKTIGHVPEHDKFKPVIKSIVLEANKLLVTYEYHEDKDSPTKKTFTSELIVDGDTITQSTTGKNLVIHGYGRGITDSANQVENVKKINQIRTKEGKKGDRLVTPNKKEDFNKLSKSEQARTVSFDNSHILANMFMGSGYKEALNLLTTSSHYNQKTMKKAEEEGIMDKLKLIQKEVQKNDPNAYISFDITVTATWDKLLDNEVYDLLKSDKKWPADKNEKSEALKQAVAKLAKADDPVMVKSVDYLVTVVKLHKQRAFPVVLPISPAIYDNIEEESNLSLMLCINQENLAMSEKQIV